MRIVFMGTPTFASTILSYLIEQHEVVGVFTRPDAVRGRGKSLVASPVKEVAQQNEIPVYECTSFTKDEAAFEALVALKPQLIVVAAFSVLLPKKVLELPEQGCVNVHASKLPRWRGAAPVERAILAQDESAGVCVMKMEEGLDTGDYSIERSIEIGSFTAEELTQELADLGAEALLTCIGHMEMGRVFWTPQDETRVTYAHKIEKGELNIYPGLSAGQAQARVQASGASHPCKCVVAGKEVTVEKSSLFQVGEKDENLTVQAGPGQVVFVVKRLFIGFADGILELKKVKPTGKKSMDAPAFAAGIQGIKKGGFTWEGLNS